MSPAVVPALQEISAVNITTLNEYQECLNLTQEILL